jgi:thymidylate synthase
MEKKLNIIFNRNIQNIIGLNNDLLVNIREDLQWFKEHTNGNIIVMGYNTLKSLPGKEAFNFLKGRLNVIISKNHYQELTDESNRLDEEYGRNRSHSQFIVYDSFESFYSTWFCLETDISCEPGDFLEGYKNREQIFVIGGSQLYNEVLSNYRVDTIYETLCDIKVDIESIISDGNDISYFSSKISKEIFKKTYEKVYKDGVKLNGGLKYGWINQSALYTFSIYHNKENINEEEFNYLKLLRFVSENGTPKDSRNSKVISYFSPPSIKYDLRNGFPLLTSKKVGWKTVLRELLWFIKGSTNNKELQAKNVHIWDGNSTREYMKTIGLEHYPEGDLGPIYGFQWRHFGAKYYGCHYDYSNRGVDQLKYVIDEIKNNPTSRRIILNSWNAADLDQMALPPCHVMVQFNVDVENHFIDAKLTQRSGDMFLGVPFNIASYSMLLHIIGNITGYIPRYFIHDIGDAHIYDNHKDAIETQLKRGTYNFPKFVITKDIQDIDNIDETFFDLINYKYFPTIKAPMSA